VPSLDKGNPVKDRHKNDKPDNTMSFPRHESKAPSPLSPILYPHAQPPHNTAQHRTTPHNTAQHRKTQIREEILGVLIRNRLLQKQQSFDFFLNKAKYPFSISKIIE
jgi:hypothetical protein